MNERCFSPSRLATHHIIPSTSRATTLSRPRFAVAASPAAPSADKISPLSGSIMALPLRDTSSFRKPKTRIHPRPTFTPLKTASPTSWCAWWWCWARLPRVAMGRRDVIWCYAGMGHPQTQIRTIAAYLSAFPENGIFACSRGVVRCACVASVWRTYRIMVRVRVRWFACYETGGGSSRTRGSAGGGGEWPIFDRREKVLAAPDSCTRGSAAVHILNSDSYQASLVYRTTRNPRERKCERKIRTQKQIPI